MLSEQSDHSPRLIVFGVVFILLSTLAVSLRLIARRISVAGFWWDDAFMILSLLLSFGSYAMVFVGM